MRKLLVVFMFFFILPLFCEEYIERVEVFIPFGEADSLLGYKPPAYVVDKGGDTVHTELGQGAASWDVQGGKLYVTDGVDDKILVYDLEGRFIKTIGTWKERKNERKIKSTSGEGKIIKAYQSSSIITGDSIRYKPDEPKKYFKEIGDIAVDGKGNIYTITRYREERTFISDLDGKERDYTTITSGLMKFSPEGKLLEIIDKFGEYGREEIKDIDLYSPKNPYGDVIVTLSTKSQGSINVLLNKQGHIEYFGKTPPRQDAKGNTYKFLPTGKKWFEPKPKQLIGIIDKNESIEDTISIYFDPPIRSTFFGVDGEGNLYFSSGATILKYDQKGNLLARISIPSIVREKEGVSVRPMANVGKIMKDGSFYIAYHFVDGLRLIKLYIKPSTEGKVLKPAVKKE
ncbi:hypothetical protein KAW18_18010 [candidate division WOR-3 bacterium]|nr:hypothetical protein [candidate division WOR-3 bacterium]